MKFEIEIRQDMIAKKEHVKIGGIDVSEYVDRVVYSGRPWVGRVTISFNARTPVSIYGALDAKIIGDRSDDPICPTCQEIVHDHDCPDRVTDCPEDCRGQE